MKKYLFMTACLFLTTQAHGALSAYHQGTREIKDLLNSEELKIALSQSYPISEIKLLDNQHDYRIYSVTAGEKTMWAKITYIKSAKLGPRQYQIELMEANQ
jgi:hypothetical protein